MPRSSTAGGARRLRGVRTRCAARFRADRVQHEVSAGWTTVIDGAHISEQETRRGKADEIGVFALEEYPKYVAAARSVADTEGAVFVGTSTLCDDTDERCCKGAVHLTVTANVLMAERLQPAQSGLLREADGRTGRRSE